jgi:hypothetical protein
MLLQNQVCSLLFAAMAGRDVACHFKFQALPGFFVDFAEEARHSASFRATTLPRLGLIERSYETDGIIETVGSVGNDKKPWERFRDYVDHLNNQNTASTTYKVLYITRHGLGYHNIFESKVGRDAWNVGNISLFVIFRSCQL